MIQSVHNYTVSQLFDTEANVVYSVPKYQREYAWNKTEWEELFDDILENDRGYFLGSIICINQTPDPLSIQRLEVIDGQQRLVSISLLYLAIYSYLYENKDKLDDEQKVELINVKRRLILKKDQNQIRVEPSYQNHNYDDYHLLFSQFNFVSIKKKPSNAGNRKILKAYRYFVNRLNVTDKSNKPKFTLMDILKLLEKLGSTSLVKMDVASHADAYILFESLNNRGVPLSAIDIIKNKLLSKLEHSKHRSIEENFNDWDRLLSLITDDLANQERFFRHYYNAFKQVLEIDGYPIATRSNLIIIYEELIKKNAVRFLSEILRAGEIYSLFLKPEEELSGSDKKLKKLKTALLNLKRINAAPSHLLLLYLMKEKDRLSLKDNDIAQIVEYLVKFFVRRHLTDIPPTRDLISLFMSIVKKLQKIDSAEVANIIKFELNNISASDREFVKCLQGLIYQENSWVTRFILCSIEESNSTKETMVDLWKLDGKQYVWTVEHIFPQGEKIPIDWINMVADGDEKKAKEFQKKYVHTIGNLTISGYNSSLGNKSFEEKKRRRDHKGKHVGYMNGLFLNADLAKKTAWKIPDIEERTEILVKLALEIFSLEVSKY